MGGIGQKISKAIVGVIIGLMVLSFAIWGMEDVFQPGNRNAVATLGDEPILDTDFRDAFRREVDRINQERVAAGQGGLTNEQAVAQGIDDRILGQLVVEKIIDLDARDLGIGVDARMARDAAAEVESFRNPITGELDLELMDSILRRNRMTRAQFEEDLLDGLRRQQTVPAILDGIDVPGSFAEERFRFLNEQRRASVATFGESAVTVPEDPDEATLSAWIDSNERLYIAPEFRRFELLRVEPFDILPDLEVTEAQIEDQYQLLLDGSGGDDPLRQPETRDLVQVRADSEADAREIARRVNAGEDVDTVVASLSLSPERLSGVTPDGILDTEVARAAFETPEGEAAAVLGSLPFWYAVVVTEVTPATEPTLEEVRDEVEASLLADLAQDRIFDVSGEVEDLMDENSTFDEIAEELGLVLATYDFVDREGRTQDGLFMGGLRSMPGVAADDSILREVFTNDTGYETDLFESEGGGLFAVRVVDVIDSRRRPLDEIRERAVADWKTKQVEDALLELARLAQRRVRDGESLGAVAAEFGGEVDTAILVRTAANPDVGDEAEVELMTADVGDVLRGAGPEPLTQQVAVLEAISGSGDRLGGRFADTLREATRNEIAADIDQAYRQAVIRENPVEENEARVRSVLGIDTN